MSANPFGGFNPKPSPWGYNWTAEVCLSAAPEPPTRPKETPTQAPPTQPQSSSPEPHMLAQQYANMPAALLNSMKREKKPFTYTPGGVNLSEVLNARLQKRMERKKKYSEERQFSEDGLPCFDPPKQVVVMRTYNTALDMYSMENALEMLEAQAELVANDRNLSSPSRSATLPRNHTFRFEEKDLDPGRGVAQSRAFKVLQIITDTEEEPPSDRGKGHHQDEMQFTGIRESKAIPSKFFHTLQKITGTEEEEVAPRSSMHEHGTAPAPRAPLVQQQNFPQQAPSNSPRVFPQQQTMAPQPQCNSNPSGLKRPAAFLPIKTTPGYGGFRPVSAPFLSNGSIKRVGNPAVGTDF